MSRLLTLLLLYKAGYEVGRFISIEKLIDQSKETYHEALAASTERWHEPEHNLRPWLFYFLGVVTAAYREFEPRAEAVTAGRGSKAELVKSFVRANLSDAFTFAEVKRASPGVSDEYIRQVLRELRDAGVLRLRAIPFLERRVLSRRRPLCLEQHRIGLLPRLPPVHDLQQQTPLVPEVEQIRERLPFSQSEFAQRRPPTSDCVVSRIQLIRCLVANTLRIPPVAAHPEGVHVGVRPSEGEPQRLVQLLERLILPHRDGSQHRFRRPLDARRVRNEHRLKREHLHQPMLRQRRAPTADRIASPTLTSIARLLSSATLSEHQAMLVAPKRSRQFAAVPAAFAGVSSHPAHQRSQPLSHVFGCSR